MSNPNWWVISDTHFGHSNIVRGTTEWGPDNNKTRDFDTVKEHDECLLDGINSNVKEDDILVHLGDWSFGGKDNIIKYRNLVKCKTIYLAYGNHDHHIRKIGSDEYKAFTTADWIIDRSDVKHGPKFYAQHCKCAAWFKQGKGVPHFYGHSHANAEWLKLGRSIDCGVDNAKILLGEYRPFSWDELDNMMKQIPIKSIDHHNLLTND